MKKKVSVLLGLVVLLMLVSVISIKKVKSSAKTRHATQVAAVEKTATSQSEKETEEKSIFDEEQVVTKDIYPKKTMTGEEISEDVLPKGTVVTVKPVPNKEDWVEIDSDPAKGFIKASYLESRQLHIDERNAKRKNKLSADELTKTLDSEIKKFIAEHGGDLSIYLETVDSKYSYSFFGDEVKRTASSIKLPFITYVMTLADQQKIDLNTKLTYTAGFKIDGTGIIQFEPIGTQYTIEELAELVIRYSDNVAYLMLLNYVGEPAFVQYLHELDPTSPNNRVFSTAKILTKAMKRVNENKDSSDNINKLYNWMQDSTFDDGVDVGLPGVDVVHKTGWMPMYTVSNDISLVKDEHNPYYLTIMTVGYDESYSEKSISDLAWLIDEVMLEMDQR